MDAVDIDTEQAKLATYELGLVFAVARRDAIGLLRDGLAQVTEGPIPADLSSDGDVVAELLLDQANYGAALSTLAVPVQRSLSEFVSR